MEKLPTEPAIPESGSFEMPEAEKQESRREAPARLSLIRSLMAAAFLTGAISMPAEKASAGESRAPGAHEQENLGDKDRETHDRAEMVRIAGPLEKKVGALGSVVFMEKAGVSQGPEKSHEVQIAGMELLDSKLTPERVNETLRQMPPSFRANLVKIEYRNAKVPVAQVDPKAGMSRFESAHAERAAGKVVFTGGMRDFYTEEVFDDTLRHEAAHVGDWQGRNDLSALQRIQLLAAVVGRIEDPHHYPSQYVDSIKDADPKAAMMRKAAEYYAVLGSAYFSEKIPLLKADEDMMDWRVEMTDKGYAEARKKRIAERLRQADAASRPVANEKPYMPPRMAVEAEPMRSVPQPAETGHNAEAPKTYTAERLIPHTRTVMTPYGPKRITEYETARYETFAKPNQNQK